MTPQRYRQSDGTWQEIDSELVQTPLFPTVWQNKINEWTVKFESMGLFGDGVTIYDDSGKVNFNPIGGSPVDPVVSGEAPYQKVTYKNVWQGIDLEYNVTNTTVKENIIVHKNAKRTDFKFMLSGGGHLESIGDEGEYVIRGVLGDKFRVDPVSVAINDKGYVGAAPYVSQALIDSKQIRISVIQIGLNRCPTLLTP